MRTQKARKAASRSVQQTRARKARFDAAHVKGMKALQEKDYNLLGEAIREEGEIVIENAPALAAGKRSASTRKK